MPEITFEWDNPEQTVIIAQYPKGWTWDDYHRVIDRVADALIAHDEPVSFINVYAPGAVHPGSAPITHYRRTLRTVKVAYFAYITTDALVIATLKAFVKLMDLPQGDRWDIFATVEEGRQFIHARMKQGSTD